jgi:lysophospholipase L1-like esterase
MTRHPWRLALLATALIASLSGCAPEPQPADDRAPGQTRVAFYGDSYTLGTGASDLTLRWSTIISEARGWSEFNPSVNGLGFVNNRSAYGDGDLPSLVIADDPDIVFVTMGLNDNFSFDRAADRIREQITVDLTRLRTGLPDARLIVVEPFWYTDVRPASVETIIGWVRDAADAVSADYIPGASRWIEGHPEWMASDGLHPNDAGYAEMARRMDAELSLLGL